MFRGIQKVTLIDFPEVIASTLFVGGCNFDCLWCHNRSLVEPGLFENLEIIPEDDIKSYLLKRKGKIQGVCITGGEPTLWGDKLKKFLEWSKSEGFKNKLDTNGYLYEVLEDYIKSNVLDFIAMDIKNTYEKYSLTVNIKNIDISRIKKSIEIIKKSNIPHIFRTTVVPDLVDIEEMKEFSKKEDLNLVFQEYREKKSNIY